LASAAGRPGTPARQALAFTGLDIRMRILIGFVFAGL
jgi:hypothetical protein